MAARMTCGSAPTGTLPPSVARRELLRSFLGMIGNNARHESGPLELPLRDWQVAQLLGVTRQYLSRLMQELEAGGTLRRSGKRWVLLPADRCEESEGMVH